MRDDVRVLVVDDSPDEAQTIAMMLKLDGYHVEIAAEGALALEQVQRFRPQCVVLDINMPRMNGLEIARHMRAQYADDVVLIAMTGFDADDPIVRQAFGIVDHYLRKPVHYEALRKVLPPTWPRSARSRPMACDESSEPRDPGT